VNCEQPQYLMCQMSMVKFTHFSSGLIGS